jgi:hypothetical protein
MGDNLVPTVLSVGGSVFCSRSMYARSQCMNLTAEYPLDLLEVEELTRPSAERNNGAPLR